MIPLRMPKSRSIFGAQRAEKAVDNFSWWYFTATRRLFLRIKLKMIGLSYDSYFL
jgi:hypothetical protein